MGCYKNQRKRKSREAAQVHPAETVDEETVSLQSSGIEGFLDHHSWHYYDYNEYTSTPILLPPGGSWKLLSLFSTLDSAPCLQACL